MALTNPCFKDQNWSHLRENRERRKEEEEEEKKRRRGDQVKIKPTRYGN